MARPDYKGGKPRLQRGVEITDELHIGFWFNIDAPDLRARLDAYYKAAAADKENGWKREPGVQLQVKVGNEFMTVCKSRLWLDTGPPAAPQAPAAPPPPPPGYAPAPPPHTSVPDAPPPPAGYEAAKNG